MSVHASAATETHLELLGELLSLLDNLLIHWCGRYCAVLVVFLGNVNNLGGVPN